METLEFYSECSEKFNAQILRELVAALDYYREALPLGWRVISELQRANEAQPYYQLDLCSKKGAGKAAPEKMATLRWFPEHAYTGYATMEEFLQDLYAMNFNTRYPELFQKILGVPAMRAMPLDLHNEYAEASGFSAWYGGIRLPYDILETKKLKASATLEGSPVPRKTQNEVRRTTGEIRVAFSGGKEWQDIFLSFMIMRIIQKAMMKRWKRDQIKFKPEKLEKGDPQVAFCAIALPLMHHAIK